MNALLTDLYELTMAAGYYQTGKAAEIATFELTIRRLPPQRTFVVAAGLAQVVEYLTNLSFKSDEIRYLRGLPQFANAPGEFFPYLQNLRFTGDLTAAPEGSVLFAGEPLLTLRAPVIEAQIAETYLLATIAHQSMVATKAARIVESAGGRDVVEFGTRRAHSPHAGTLGARAAYIGGCIGSSNTLAGFLYGIPVYGTAAHSWVMAFPDEMEAFRCLQKLLGPSTIYIVDTYDTLEGVRKAISLGRPFWGVRLDSGDMAALSTQARALLDGAGFRDARIMASGDLNEYRIRELAAAGAPIDAFGVGTDLATSSDAPSLGAIYKIVELEREGVKRYAAKFSADKVSMPGAKQIFRYPGKDVIGCADEIPGPLEGTPHEPLLEPVMKNGELLRPLPDAKTARQRTAASLGKLNERYRRLENAEPYPVEHSPALLALTENARRDLIKVEV